LIVFVQELFRRGTLALQGHDHGGKHRGPQGAEFPGFGLWISLVEVMQKGGVSEVPEA